MGKPYAGHPALREQFDAPKDLFRAASLLLDDPRQRPPSMVVTRRGPPASLALEPGRLWRQPTENPQPPPPPSEDTMAAGAEPASTLTQREADVSSLYELPDTIISLKESSTTSTSTSDSSPASASALGSPIYFFSPPNWHQCFYARMDHQGSFHMYPDLGGPYHSVQEAENAIDNHLNKLRCPSVCREQYDSNVEWLVQRCLYYPDGTPKRGPNSPGRKNPNEDERQLVRALLAQYNDDHKLNEDLAHELKDLVSFMWIYEDNMSYLHLNFTTKTKNPDDGNLFFAELTILQNEVWKVSCFCMIQPNDNGICYGCINNEIVKTTHPNDTRAFIGGHVDGYLPFGGDPQSDSDDDDEEALRARLRFKFRGC